MENKKEIITTTSPSLILYLSHSSFFNPNFLSLSYKHINLTKRHLIFLPLLFLSFSLFSFSPSLPSVILSAPPFLSATKDLVIFIHMDEFALIRFDAIGSTVRKKRSQIFRRAKDSQAFINSHDYSPSSISPPSYDVRKDSSDETADNSGRKESNLTQSVSRVSLAVRAESNSNSGKSIINNKYSSEDVLAPVYWKNTRKLKECMDVESRTANVFSGRNGEIRCSEQLGADLDTLGDERKVKKVKLKVGGVAHIINANSTTNVVSSSKNSRSSDASRPRQKLSHKGNLEEEQLVSGKRLGLQGVPWKDFSRGGFSLGKEHCLMRKTSSKGMSGKQGDKSELVRKSKRAPKRHSLDGEFAEDDEDDEIRYLEKLRNATKHQEDDGNDDGESSKKQRKLSTLESNGASRIVKDGKKLSRPDQPPEDMDHEEEPLSGGEFEGSKKQQKKESIESLTDVKREIMLTKRQRALQSSKDGSYVPDADFIEFPDGLPPAPSKKQKEQLTEIEQQLKKAEAAQRRRMQVEKAARESEAEAIRKILGQDSSRKKREEKMKKRQEELAQEKAANALMLASNTIRWVMGPSGTVVTFPNDMGLPSIFDSRTSSYPPPREKCAGPSCTNPYKYRDSKSRLPLCSLQCYKAIQQHRQPDGS